jgi:hypothetical protein
MRVAWTLLLAALMTVCTQRSRQRNRQDHAVSHRGELIGNVEHGGRALHVIDVLLRPGTRDQT